VAATIHPDLFGADAPNGNFCSPVPGFCVIPPVFALLAVLLIRAKR
jgi:hypothetical protein